MFEKIVYRELIIKYTNDDKNTNNDDEIENNLDNFIKDTEGKKYSFNYCNKILCCKKIKDYEKNKEWSKCSGFFCSQLVAAAYMYLNILKMEQCSDQYLPGNFLILYKVLLQKIVN